MPDISQEEIQRLRNSFAPLIGIKIDWLSIPDQALQGFEPSQVAVIVNTLLDGILPQIQLISTDKKNLRILDYKNYQVELEKGKVIPTIFIFQVHE